MNKGLKTLAMWLILGIIFIVVVSSIMDNSQNKMKYSELMIAIESGKVENIQLASDGTKGYITLKDNPKIEKEVNIPSVDSFMDKISSYLVEGSFTLEEKSESTIITILSLLSPFGIVIIFFLFWGTGNNNNCSHGPRG